MALGDYEGPGKVFFNNNLLAESQSVRMNFNGNNTRVKTMKRGLAGRSRGAFETEFSIDSAVPLAGLEVDFINLCVTNANVTVSIDLAGKRVAVDGWIESTDVEQSTDSPAQISFSGVGGKPRQL